MWRRSYFFIGLPACLLLVAWILWIRHPRAPMAPVIGDGISRELAADRQRTISALRYDLTFRIPETKTEPIRGEEILTVQLTDVDRPLVIDFGPPANQIASVKVGDKPLASELSHGHIVVPPDALQRGTNSIEISFTAGDVPLNRNDDYLYSLFVPARASQTFPCFDQPDLKASFALTLEIPASWEAVANGFETARETAGSRTTIHFSPTKPLPTYLFGFATGKFAVEHAERNGRPFRLFHRETDKEKVARNLDAIFSLHEQAIEWLEDYTAQRYPFEKLDFVLIPAFQFGGMEHAGAIFYNSSSLFLDQTATQEQELSRASTIAHETSHMWFGDLVTMKWFDDVWMKEVFANFMAAKIVNPSFPQIDHELRFLLQHYPPAYDVDRTSGANPIRQPLANLNEAGSLYGNIIYYKAPIVMRQLEQLVGADNFRDGLREYLSRFAFKNATWADLITILDARTDEDLAAWSHAWVEEPGRPTITTELKVSGGQIVSLGFTQSDPSGRGVLWNQRLQVALGFPSGARISPLAMKSARVELPLTGGAPEPSYVLPNGEGQGYGLFKLDDLSKAFLLEHLPEIGHSLTRATAWITLWDDLLEGSTQPARFIDLALRSLPAETEQQNVERILGYLTEAYWLFIPDSERLSVAQRVEPVLRTGIENSSSRSLKAAYFAAFRRMVLTRDGIAYLERLWRKQSPIEGLPFAEPDYIAMAQELALRDVPDAASVLTEQLSRIENPDRKARFVFVAPALSSDQAVRDRFFSSLSVAENRRHEPWVIDGLAFLNHPLRRLHAEQYIRPSLEMLKEIQRTGDIFFPIRWTDAVLGSHNSPSAARIVTDFLGQQNYPPRLRNVIEQTSDTLIRASKIQR